jgi:hypothetical protein
MLTKKTLATGVAATTIMFGFGAVAPAWATSNLQVFGVQETVKDLSGPLTGYTVTGLMPSSDPVPYPVAGRLYEATVKADALVGTASPAVPFFNARAENGDNYRVLANVSSLSGGPIGQGDSTTGKVYFDVVGAMPNSVVFNNGAEDILGWVMPPGVSPEELAPPASGGGSEGGAEGSSGSTGPNQASPDTTASTGAGNSDVEGADAGSGGTGGAAGASEGGG